MPCGIYWRESRQRMGSERVRWLAIPHTIYFQNFIKTSSNLHDFGAFSGELGLHNFNLLNIIEQKVSFH